MSAANVLRLMHTKPWLASDAGTSADDERHDQPVARTSWPAGSTPPTAEPALGRGHLKLRIDGDNSPLFLYDPRRVLTLRGGLGAECRQRSSPCHQALDSALRRRCPGQPGCFPRTQGSTYAEDYQDVLRGTGHHLQQAGVETATTTPSPGELVLDGGEGHFSERFDSYASAKEKLFDYIEVFYNQQRRHSSLDYAQADVSTKNRPIELAA